MSDSELRGSVRAVVQEVVGAVRRVGSTWVSGFVVATVALSVAVTVGLFAVVNGVLYKKHPGTAALASLIPIQLVWNGRVKEDAQLTPPYLSELLRDQPRTLSQLASFRGFQAHAFVGRQELLLLGEVVSGDYFNLLGVRPVAGRLLSQLDSESSAAPVAVVSERLWRDQLAATLDLSASTITINHISFQVVGVAPRAFPGLFAWSVVSRDVWISRTYGPVVDPYQGGMTFGQLAPGASLGQLRTELAGIRVDDGSSLPHTLSAGWGTLDDLIDRRPMQMVAVAWVGLALVGILYAVGLGNLLLLLAVRVEARTQEFLLRLALGSGPDRIVRLVSAETLVLVLLGGIIGVVGAVGATPWVFRALVLESGGVVPDVNLTIDWRVGLYAAVVLGLTALGFARALAARVIALDGQEAGLLSHDRVAPGWRGLRGRTLAVQLAFATALVTVAVVFARGSQSAVARAESGLAPNTVVGWHRVDTGVTPSSVVSALAFLPAVDRISVASSLPGSSPRTRVTLPGGTESRARCVGVEEAFFSAVDIRITEGRPLSANDGDAVAVVSQALADTLWPEGGALGRQIALSDCLGTKNAVEVVGIAQDAAAALDQGGGRAVYVPLRTDNLRIAAVFLRGPLSAQALTTQVKTALQASGKTGLLYDVSPLVEQIAGVDGPQQGAQLLIRGLAALAALMAVIGIVGLSLQATLDARRELAIRRMLGATRLSSVVTIIRGLSSWELGRAVLLGLAAGSFGCALLQSSVRYLPVFDWLSGVIVAASGLALSVVSVAVPVLWRLRRREESLSRELA